MKPTITLYCTVESFCFDRGRNAYWCSHCHKKWISGFYMRDGENHPEPFSQLIVREVEEHFHIEENDQWADGVSGYWNWQAKMIPDDIL